MIRQSLCQLLVGLALVVLFSQVYGQTREATPASVVMAEGRAAAEVFVAAQGLFAEDFNTRLDAVRTLGRLSGALPQLVLRAVQDDQLVREGAEVYLQEGDSFVSLRTGATRDTPPSNGSYPVLNNLLRSEIDRVLAQYALRSKDPIERQQAVRSLLDAPEDIELSVIQEALSNESNPDLRYALTLLRDIRGFQLATAANATDEQRLYSESIGNSSLRQAESFLQGIRAEVRDAGVLQSIDASLERIQAKRARGAMANTLFTGISLGSVLLLAALGLAISYGLIGVINMAHGEFLMLGAYTTYLVQVMFQAYLPTEWFSFYLAVAVPSAFVVCGAFGLMVEWLILRHLYGRPLETLLATFGLSLIMMQAVRVVFGAQNVQVANPDWMSGALSPLQFLLPGLVIPNNRLVIVGFSLAVLVLTWLVLTRTRLGLYIRGTTQNRSMASCVGVATRRVDSLAFGLGTGVAGLGGVALSQIGNVGPDLGQAYIIDSFMVVVLGGVGQLAGAVVGAMGLGIASKFAEPLVGAVLAKIAILILIILFIQKRPSGLFALKGRSAES
jgi:urea transport system permease protein